MDKKEKTKKPEKKKAAKKPPENPNQYEAFESVLARLVTPVVADKR